MQANEVHVRHPGGKLNGGQHVLEGYAELVLVKSRGDFLVRMRVHIGIHAERNPCTHAGLGGKGIYHFKLGEAFHVETVNAGFKRKLYLAVALPYSGENDVAAFESARQRSLYLSTGDAVCAQSVGGNELEQARVGVCLHGVVHVEVGVCGRASLYGVKGFAKETEVVVVERCLCCLEAFDRELHGVCVLYSFVCTDSACGFAALHGT